MMSLVERSADGQKFVLLALARMSGLQKELKCFCLKTPNQELSFKKTTLNHETLYEYSL